MASAPLRPKLHKPHFFELPLEHAAELEEPEVVAGHSSLDLQHAAIHHHQIPDGYLVPPFGLC